MASLFSACAAPAPLAVGYVEGEYVLLAPIEVAEVETVSVRRGDRVEAGEAIADAGERRRQDRGRAGGSRARPGRGAARRSQDRQAPGRNRRAGSDGQIRPGAEGGGRARADAARRPARARHRRHRPTTTRPQTARRRRDARGRPGRGQSRRRQAAGARRDDQGGREPGQAGEGAARAGEVAAVEAHDRGALRPAASTTSSAIPAMSPGRRRRSSRCCRTAR